MARPWYSGYCLTLQLWALSAFLSAPRSSVTHLSDRFLMSAPALPGLPFLTPFLMYVSFTHVALSGSVSWSQNTETASLFFFLKPLRSFSLFLCYSLSCIRDFVEICPFWLLFSRCFVNVNRTATDSLNKPSMLPSEAYLITLSCLLTRRFGYKGFLTSILF